MLAVEAEVLLALIPLVRVAQEVVATVQIPRLHQQREPLTQVVAAEAA